MKKYVLTIAPFVLLFHYHTYGQAKDAGMRVRARPLELNRVRLLGGPLKRAQDLDAKYLLELEPDRMLAYYRQRAGLEPKAKPYSGWDGAGRNLTGHIAGHYLSAVSLMWAATGDARFKERADYIVKELKEVQDKHGDTVDVTLPKTLYLEPLPDNQRRVAIVWGPLVLAGDLGPERRGRRGDRNRSSLERTPIFIAAERPVEEWLKPAGDKPGHFRTDGVGRQRDVDFVPFYQLHRRTYAVYWDLFTEPEWKEKEAEYAAEEERLRKLEAATVAYAQPGEMQPERDFNFQNPGDSWVVRMMGRPGRWGRSWFSFELPVESDRPMTLVLTYCSDHHSRGKAVFDILVDGQRAAHQEVTRSSPARFYDVEYPISANLIEGKEKVTVRFQATEGSVVAAIFGIRMIRANAER